MSTDRRTTVLYATLLLSVLLLQIPTKAQSVTPQAGNLAQLIHPETADRLSLDDVQRVQLQDLLQTRAEKLLEAPDAATKAKVAADFEVQILAVLTDEQRAKFLEQEAQQKLMFQFREMKWEDVLNWFAEQQELTLVMDRTPGGTFTYSDTRSYSANEGIDLLNSVLMTRGFTLVRREKMLVVMELGDSIPLELLPRVPLEKLSERGRFELVSVVFPLAGRPIDAVLGEVKPYLSGTGRAIPLAQSSQLLVVETAGKMKMINELIASVPVPQPPPKPDKPEPPPQPVFAAYPLGALDGVATLETIRTLIPSEQITVDSKTGLLSAYVIPAQQMAIKTALDQMQANSGDEQPVESTAYRFAGMTPKEMLEQIAALAPQAVATATADRVLVTASPADQRMIQNALAALDILPANEPRSLKVFEVDTKQAEVVGTALRNFLPNCLVATNPSLGSVMVRGSDEDLKIASDIIEMWTQSHAIGQKQLRAFELQREADATWLATVAKIVPDATTWLGNEGRQLMVLATTEEITTVESVLPQLLSLLPEAESRELKIYTLTKTQLARRTALADLPKDLADIKIIDGNRGELNVWGTSAQHVQLSELLRLLDQPLTAPPATIPKTYPLTVRESALVMQVLGTEFPEAKISVSGDGKELTVVASEIEQPLVAERIATFNQLLPERSQEVLESYAVPDMTVAALQQSLTPILGSSRTVVDTTGNRLLVWADSATHANLQQLVAALVEEPDVAMQKVVVAYPLAHASATSAKTLIDQMVTNALVLADEKLGQIVVTGTLEHQALVKAAVVQIDRAGSERQPAELRSYDVGKFQASVLLTPLQAMWPDMQLSVDPTANRLLATGGLKSHESLSSTLDRLLSAPAGKESSVRTYSVPAGEMTTLPTVLLQIAPQSIISSDPTSRTLTVWATEEMHARVAQALEQIGKAAQQSHEPATYLVRPTQLVAVQTSLRTLFPSIGIAADSTTGQLIVVAPADMQARIASVIELMSSGPDAANKTTAVFKVDPQQAELADLLVALQATLSPQVRLESNALNNTILAIGSPEELEQVRIQFEAIIQQMPAAITNSSIVYELKHASPLSALTVLSTLVPRATLAQDASTRTIAATARQEDHAKIAEFLAAFDTPRSAAGQMVKTYSVPFGEMATLPTLLSQIAPQALVSSDVTSRTITVWASEELQARIQQTIDQISVTAKDATKPATYNVKPTQLLAIQTSLKTLFPAIVITADPTTGQLIVVASEELQVRVAAVVELMSNGPNAGEKTTAVFQIDSERTTLANVLAALQATIPAQVKLESNPLNSTILAIGTPEELERVKELYERLLEQLPAPEKKSSVVYQLEHGNTTSALTVLTTLLPRATFAQDVATRTIAATALPQDHLRIAEFIKSFDLPKHSDLETRVYRLKVGSARGLQTVLTQLIPEATIYGSREAGVLVATATKEQHERIAAIVKEADADRPNLETRVFSLVNGDVDSLENAVQGFAPEASVVADADSRSLIVTATKEELERVARIVEQIELGGPARGMTRFYPINGSEPAPLVVALKQSFPKATLSADAVSGGLFATASDEEHTELTKVIDELNAQPTRRPSLKSFVLKHASPVVVAAAIQDAMGRRSSGGVSFSRATQTVFVVGSREELQVAAELIEQIDVANSPDPNRKLRSFALGGADGSTVVEAIESMFEGSSTPVDVNYDDINEQLLVTAGAEQLELVKETLSQFLPPKRELEIIQLTSADPYSFKTAADAMFEDEPSYTAPSITIDSDQQQVLIRATAEQLESLHSLMEQMGEANIANRQMSGGGRLRFVPVVRNSDKLLEQIERLWPTVRENPLKVIRPKQSPQANPDEGASLFPAQPESLESLPTQLVSTPINNELTARAAHSQQDTASNAKRESDADEQDEEAVRQLPPVVVVANNDRWTLASEDTAALDQFERLLAMVLSPKVEPFATTGNYSVYLLQHAGAENVQELLTELFRPADRTSQRSALSDLMRRVKIVADARINALIVNGSRADRSIVEQLLGVLDSEDLVDTLQQITPTMLPLENASADNVVDIIRDVYRSQLAVGAGRRPVTIPEGVSSEVATLLQQINAQAAGPLLTVAVDETTNSVVMRAPAELSREIIKFVDSLDQQAAATPSKRVDLIRLKSTNAKNLEKALDILLSR